MSKSAPPELPGSSLPGSQTSADGLVVHEWGTYTSMAGSDGVLLSGMQHEEEKLPAFVYGRNSESLGVSPSGCVSATDPCGCKCMETSETGGGLERVTQKLETPVLYFYSPKPIELTARVRFPGGIISESYPNASSYGPALAQWRELANGIMDWKVKVQTKEADLPLVQSGEPWSFARQVAANSLEVSGERERFIFYRGLGRFEVPFRVTANASGLTLSNLSAQAIPAAFLLRVHAGGAVVKSLGPIAPGGTLTGIEVPLGEKERTLDTFVTEASALIAGSLVEAGLYPDEARAMVNTWSRSYFRKSGVRVLYVVPRAWTDSLLPLEMAPAPEKLVRVLVGRAEVLTLDEEEDLVGRMSQASQSGTPSPEVLLAEMGRFAEPKLQRLVGIISDPELRNYAASLLAKAKTQP